MRDAADALAASAANTEPHADVVALAGVPAARDAARLAAALQERFWSQYA